MKRALAGIAVVAAGIMGAGCTSTNVTSLAKAWANDKSTFAANVGSVYGTVRIVRIGEQTPGTTVTASPDGTVTVSVPPLPAEPGNVVNITGDR